jgi:hypothetical protein
MEECYGPKHVDLEDSDPFAGYKDPILKPVYDLV